MINNIRHDKIKDYSFSDISKYLDRVLDLVPWSEFSQQEFLLFVVKDLLLSAALSIMAEVVKDPARLTKSSYSWRTNQDTVKELLGKVEVLTRIYHLITSTQMVYSYFLLKVTA